MNFEIKFVKNPHAGHTELWREVFGDSEDFIRCVTAADAYYGAVTAVISGETAGAAHLLSLSGGNAFYCYAVAVKERYRGRGIGQALMKYIKQFCSETGASVLLHPASPSLCDFYGRLGFRPLLYRSSFSCVGDGGAFAPISAEEYAVMREMSFGGGNFLGWSSELLSLTGLSYIGFDIDGEYCAAAVCGGCVHEVCASPVSYGKAVRRAASFFEGGAKVFEMTDIPMGAETAVMGYNADGDLYFNFFLD